MNDSVKGALNDKPFDSKFRLIADLLESNPPFPETGYAVILAAVGKENTINRGASYAFGTPGAPGDGAIMALGQAVLSAFHALSALATAQGTGDQGYDRVRIIIEALSFVRNFMDETPMASAMRVDVVRACETLFFLCDYVMADPDSAMRSRTNANRKDRHA